jgi:hypothetical protein
VRLTIFFFLSLLFTLAGCAPVDHVEPKASAAGKNAPTPAAEDDQAFSQDVEMTAVSPTASPDQEAWQDYTLPDAGLTLSYPRDLYVHQAPKSVQISSSRQPTWSSFADPQPDERGLLFDLLYNLNRQMGAAPQQEIENIKGSFEEELEVINSPAPWPAASNVLIGAYRFINEKEGMALLIGAAPNPNPNSPQPTIGLISVVKEEKMAAVYPIFAGILSSVRPAAE